MPFNNTGLTLGRGRYNNVSAETESAIHLYKTDDTLAQVLATDYFPPFLSATDGNVSSNDTIIIYASDNTQAQAIGTTNPIVLTGPVLGGDTITVDTNIQLSGALSESSYILRIHKTNKIITLNFISISDFPLGAFSIVSVVPMDVSFRPPFSMVFPMMVIDTSAKRGVIEIKDTGLIEIGTGDTQSGVFTGNPAGFSSTAITYALD